MRNLAALFLCVAALSAGLAAGSLAARAASSEVVSLRRLTQEEYRHSIADIFGPEIEIRGTFEPTRRMGGLEATSTGVLSITPAGFEILHQDGGQHRHPGDSGEILAPSCHAHPNLPPHPMMPAWRRCSVTMACLLFRRPLTPDEVKNGVNLGHTLAKSSNDFYAGLRYSLATLIQAPDFLFRKEEALPAGKNQYALDPYSRATRLSYLLWSTTPDNELLSAAQSGELNTAAGLDKQVTRLMASPRLETGMRGFFNDMFQLDTFDNCLEGQPVLSKVERHHCGIGQGRNAADDARPGAAFRRGHARSHDHAQDVPQSQHGGALSDSVPVQGRLGAI